MFCDLHYKQFFRNTSRHYTTGMNDDTIPPLPGYVSVKEAAKLLSISERRVYLYIEMKRLPAVRAADVLLIPLQELQNFQRQFVGRPRKNTPLWRISSEENTQFMTSINVQIRPGQEKSLTRRLREIKQEGKYLFPGTVARYIAGSETHPNRVEIILIWRSSVMPNPSERERLLKEFQQILTDVVDWNTAQFDHGEIFLHT